MIPSRQCPTCDTTLQYKSKSAFNVALKHNSDCFECGIKKRKRKKLKNSKYSHNKNFKRCCPKCSKDIWYGKIEIFNNAFLKNTMCKSCAVSIRNKKQKGKPISKKAKAYYANRDSSCWKTKEFRKKMSDIVNGKPQKSNYIVWFEKYGKEIADKKHEEFKKKISISSSGKNNPMYGKPSPTGSGNGWCGWYKDWHFRSLLELSYMINVIERFNLKWETAEQKKYSVPYEYQNVDHTYRPDFVINDKYVIDCKPKNLQNNELNSIKKKFALKHFNKLGLKFKYVKCRKLNESEILKLYNEKRIKFIERYDIKFKQKYYGNCSVWSSGER